LEFGVLVFVEEENRRSPKKILGEKRELITNTTGLLRWAQDVNQATVGRWGALSSVRHPGAIHASSSCTF